MAAVNYEVHQVNRTTFVAPVYYGELTSLGNGAFGAVW